MHMYNLEAEEKSNQLSSCCNISLEEVREVYLDYLQQGFAMQLLQGKPLQMAGQFIKDILRELERDEDLFVVSVIGEQSSGKSTLLNSLFGCGFATGSGKCTKGLYASYLKLSTSKSLLVFDSEVLLSIEEKGDGGGVFDKQITLFALACSDLVIINHKGEISSDLNDLLQVCLYAMDTLDVAKIKPNVAFVLRDQRDCTNKRVHQMALLKMQEAVQNAVDTSLKKLDDLIEIGSDSLFLLHSAFPENVCVTRSIEIPSLKFSRETFQLRKKIIQSLEKGESVLDELRDGISSSPLSDLYAHASYVWETITKYGHSLLYCKNVREIGLRKTLNDFVNDIVSEGLDDDSKGFRKLARLTFETFFEALNNAETEDSINLVSRNFEGRLEADMVSAVELLESQFDEKARDKKYEGFRSFYKNLFRVRVRREYDLQRESWKIKENKRKEEFYFKLSSKFFHDRSIELLRSTNYKKEMSKKKAEDWFKKQWDAYEQKAIARLAVKKSEDKIRFEVRNTFSQVVGVTNYKIGERLVPLDIPHDSPFSKEHGLFFQENNWSEYVHLPKKFRKEKEVAPQQSFLSSWFPFANVFQQRRTLSSSQQFVHENLQTIRDRARRVVDNLILSINGPDPQPFSSQLAKSTITEAVSVTEKAEESFSRRKGFRFLSAQFMEDFLVTLVNQSVASLLAQQKEDEKRAKDKLRADKKDYYRYCLDVVSKDRDDLNTAETFAIFYKKGLNFFIEVILKEMKVTLKRKIMEFFGEDHKQAAIRAYDQSFKALDFEHVVMYCMDANQFLYSVYAKRFETFRKQVEDGEGQQLITEVGEIYSQLQQACQCWKKEVTDSELLESSTSSKRVVKLSDFKKWLKSFGVSATCLTAFPELENYEIGKVDAFCERLRHELQKTRQNVVESLIGRVPKALSDYKRILWLTHLRGCPQRCPKCGVKCEGGSNHTGPHTVTDKLHVFPAFNQWGFIKGDKTFVNLGMCLDPKVREHYHIRGDKRYDNLDLFLKEEHPDWLPFESNPHCAEPSPEIKEAWVNCRKALIYLRNSVSDEPLIDDTPQDWIDAYETKKGTPLTENDVERLRKKLQEEV